MQFGGLLNTAWGKAATSANAINGFRICGIYPISADIIPEHVYEPSFVSDTPLSSNDTPVQPAQMTEENPYESHQENLQVAVTPTQAVNSADGICEPTASGSSVLSFRDLQPTPKIQRKRMTNDGRRQTAATLRSESYRKVLFDKVQAAHQRSSTTSKKQQKGLFGMHAGTSKDNKAKGKGKAVKKTSANDKKDDSSNYCAECNGYYFDDQDEDIEWISSQLCSRWFHEQTLIIHMCRTFPHLRGNWTFCAPLLCIHLCC
jgi:hypothetical protein